MGPDLQGVSVKTVGDDCLDVERSIAIGSQQPDTRRLGMCLLPVDR